MISKSTTIWKNFAYNLPRPKANTSCGAGGSSAESIANWDGSSGPLSPAAPRSIRETEEFWQRLGFAVIQGYGLTETTSLISVNHPFKVGQGSIGKVLAGREVKLAADGEILVRGSGVASGYWSRGGVAPGFICEEGWYHTGDIGQLDSEGNLFFKGRKKDVIVTPAGMNVYPEDLENALQAQPEVKDCVVVPSPKMGMPNLVQS